jgi:hypothetical protein
MPKLDLSEIENDPDVRMTLDKFAFEDYCGACMFFNTEDCPKYLEVDDITEWRKINCDKFWD